MHKPTWMLCRIRFEKLRSGETTLPPGNGCPHGFNTKKNTRVRDERYPQPKPPRKLGSFSISCTSLAIRIYLTKFPKPPRWVTIQIAPHAVDVVINTNNYIETTLHKGLQSLKPVALVPKVVSAQSDEPELWFGLQRVISHSALQGGPWQDGSDKNSSWALEKETTRWAVSVRKRANPTPWKWFWCSPPPHHPYSLLCTDPFPLLLPCPKNGAVLGQSVDPVPKCEGCFTLHSLSPLRNLKSPTPPESTRVPLVPSDFNTAHPRLGMRLTHASSRMIVGSDGRTEGWMMDGCVGGWMWIGQSIQLSNE